MEKEKRFTVFNHDRNSTIGIINPDGGWLCELKKDNHYYEPDEVLNNANLICEAFNVENKTGLTPSQLHLELEKAKELLKVIKSIDRGVLFMQLPSEIRESITTFLEGSGNKNK